MEINLSLVDVVFAELSISTIDYDPAKCVDPNDYDAVSVLFREVLRPWYDRLLPDNRQKLVHALTYAKSTDGASIVDRVISNCPHLPFVGDVHDPGTLLDALLSVFSVEHLKSREDFSTYVVIEDRMKANDLLIGRASTDIVDSATQTQADEVKKRFFGD